MLTQAQLANILPRLAAGETIKAIAVGMRVSIQTLRLRLHLFTGKPMSELKATGARDNQKRDNVLAAIRGGMSFSDAATSFCMSYPTVLKWAKAAGLANPYNITKATVKRVVKRLSKGENFKDITADLGFTGCKLSLAVIRHTGKTVREHKLPGTRLFLERIKALETVQAGASMTEAAKLVGVSLPCVMKWCKAEPLNLQARGKGN